jgi:hypothetical protein
MIGEGSFLYKLFNVNALRATIFLWFFFIDIKVLRTNLAVQTCNHSIQHLPLNNILPLILISNSTAEEVIFTFLLIQNPQCFAIAKAVTV